MNRPTLELLNAFLLIADKAARPTLPNLMSTRSAISFSPQKLHRLEEQGLIKRSGNSAKDWTYQITRAGALAAIGGRDPMISWSRKWDGNWRFILFDLPEKDVKSRRRLYRWLTLSHFGRLQQSVWITPDPVNDLAAQLREISTDPCSVTLIEGAPPKNLCTRTDDIVTSSWDFNKIHKHHEAYLSFVSQANLRNVPDQWYDEERALWQKAISMDPLLPTSLLPRNYLGKKIWEHHRKILGIRR